MEFEGSEKKLELHIRPEYGSLRALGDEFWAEIVGAARAAILSKLSSANCDAYLLSESSLFVYANRFTMITCGQTTLAAAALKFFATVPASEIEFLCYERKNELFPERQATSFDEDARALARVLPRGRKLRLGDKTGNYISIFFHETNYRPDPRDTTLEILMHGIGPEAVPRLSRGPAEITKAGLRRDAGIDRLLAGFKVDDHLFDPMGYSLNAVKDDWYYTVHITPNPQSPYVSFETNYHILEHGGERALQRITSRLIEAFAPESVSMLLFHQNPQLVAPGSGYQLRHELRYQLGDSYNVHFQDFRKAP